MTSSTLISARRNEVDVASDASTETVLYADAHQGSAEDYLLEPGLKGDTATNTLKPAGRTRCNGPRSLFINEGETIEIITRRFLRKPRKSISPFGNQAMPFILSSRCSTWHPGFFHLFICKAK